MRMAIINSSLTVPVNCTRATIRRRNVECSSAALDAQPTTSSTPQCNYPRPSLLHTLHRVVVPGIINFSKKCISTPSFIVDYSSNASSGSKTLPLLLGAAPAVIPLSVWEQLGANYVFMAGFVGWFVAQFLKIFTKWYKTGHFDLRAFVDSGGMPSSHSSLCSSVTTAIALQHGLGSSLFAVALCFTVIVMYDAMGVRRHAGLQAEVLNQVVEGLLEDHPISERKLKEVLGHTPRQVLAGAITGIIMGLSYPRPF